LTLNYFFYKMFVSIRDILARREVLIINYKKMLVTMEAVVIESAKGEVVKGFEDGKPLKVQGQLLEVHPDECPGKNITVKVFNPTEKFEQYKKYKFIGVLSHFNTKTGIKTNMDAKSFTLIR
jgi:hypothetical protein